MKSEFQNKKIQGLETVLPMDESYDSSPRQTPGVSGAFVEPRKPSDPELIIYSDELAKDLGLTESFIQSDQFLDIVSGRKVLPDSHPYAMNYAGHQFGHWAGQLGDGRAINLFDMEENGKRWTLQLKGAGRTAYSRSADGLAVLRSSIREFLCSEAMFHLGVPSTRALSLVLTGDSVLRDVMYDGHAAYEPGAIVSRLAPSFIRFGNFEIHSARKEYGLLQTLLDHTIKNHFPEITVEAPGNYNAFFQSVCEKTLHLMLEWHRVGFVHGVMNTDNMSILGLTIDYGPYGWTDDYNYQWTPNTTDRAERRYRFGNQANIALWNLVQLANALVPLIGEDTRGLQAGLTWYQEHYKTEYTQMMCRKLGLFQVNKSDESLVSRLEKLLHKQETDMTIFFRLLADIDPSIHHHKNALDIVHEAFYQEYEPLGSAREDWLNWFQDYLDRIKLEASSQAERQKKMNTTNPKYVLRNYMAQMAIEKAESGDYSFVHELYELLKKPYDEQTSLEKYFAKRPDWARNKVGASMLSCSS